MEHSSLATFPLIVHLVVDRNACTLFVFVWLVFKATVLCARILMNVLLRHVIQLGEDA